MILDGRLPAGERINEVQLAAQIGVSRTPLRETLSRLVTEGALRDVPRHGFFVRPLTAEEVRDIYPFRGILDPAALRLAGIPSREAIGRLREINQRLAACTDPAEAVRLDDELHLELIAEGQRLTFSLPDRKGSFRGVREGSGIVGQWIQPRTAIGRREFATPVLLRAEGGDRWRGDVVPLDDRVTHFLPVTRGTDGRFATYLRNPESNLGRFIPVSRIEAEGETIRLLGTRRGEQRETVLASGRRDAQTGLLSLPIDGRTFDFERDESESSAFYPRGRRGERYRYAPPVPLDDGWPVVALEDEGLDRAAIERFVQMVIDTRMESVSSSQIHSVLIARHGRLVLEEYFHGHDRGPHDTRSAAKSWTAVLIGAAMQAGVPIRLDTPVYQTMLGSLPADLDARKRAMTLEHLISMTAGFFCDDGNPDARRADRLLQRGAEPRRRNARADRGRAAAGAVRTARRAPAADGALSSARQSGAALRNLTPTQTYGYLWNSLAYPWRGRTLHAFFAGGNGGQIFMGIPSWTSSSASPVAITATRRS